MTLEQRVRSLTAKEIVGFLIEGIENPVGILDFDTFGYNYNTQGDVRKCSACGATQAIIKMMAVEFTANDFKNRSERLNADKWFLSVLEDALDSLRCGKVSVYNRVARELALAEMPETLIFPYISNDNYHKMIVILKEIHAKL